MTEANPITSFRLNGQCLTAPLSGTPCMLIEKMGAMQAQDFAMAYFVQRL